MPEEGRRIQRPKCCASKYPNKDEDNNSKIQHNTYQAAFFKIPRLNHSYTQINKECLKKAGGYNGRNVVLLNITIKMRTTARKFNIKLELRKMGMLV